MAFYYEGHRFRWLYVVLVYTGTGILSLILGYTIASSGG